ncbi:haloacid dehalogenase type II [Variovorax guangxiensis]|uniref:haloacid dehalogenase type II n=1 Tax=Variovorax guangxiensis TaxID=1775474 RepID=UPI00285C42BF|nr:haloacid dehalogenase type II [Variovorax guangxiensis]MDR6860161.1 2-haloacid dehalogenase [Variovorax guangxiensis]
MTLCKPKYVTFDCYGTLIHFRMADAARQLYADRIAEGRMTAFTLDFTAYRLDEVMKDWKPYREVIVESLRRACKRWAIEYRDTDGSTVYETVPTWGPHPDVPAGLAKVAKEFPLVALSNAANEQIHANVAQLGAPFYRAFTAEQAGSYKPHMRPFEYMLDELGCGPDDVLHVSSRVRYGLMPARDMGIRNKVWVRPGTEPEAPGYEYVEIRDINGLPALLGL